MQDKIVAFAGHRFEWHCKGVKEKIIPTLENLINNGYTIFMTELMVHLIKFIHMLF